MEVSGQFYTSLKENPQGRQAKALAATWRRRRMETKGVENHFAKDMPAWWSAIWWPGG